MDRPAAVPLSLADVWTAVDHERSTLADLLEDLSAQEWQQPSLCAGWTVRDVVAHLVLAHMDLRQTAVAAVRARGSFDRMVRDTALRRRTPPAQLVGELRGMVGSRRRAPGVSPLEPLLDVLVHGQDVAVPLGRPRAMPRDAAAAAATRAAALPWPLSRAFPVRRHLRGLRLVATDVDWEAGDGEVVAGPVAAVLLLLTGRGVAVDQLAGPGRDRAQAALEAVQACSRPRPLPRLQNRT